MRVSVLLSVSLLGLAPPALHAQQQQSKPQEQSVAPSANQATTAPIGGSANGSLDVCKELVAYLQRPQQSETQTGNGQTATTAPQQPPRQQSSASSPSSGANDKRPAPGQTAPNVDKPQHESGQTGPIPPAQQGSKQPTVTLDAAHAWAARGDQRGCRDAAQQMRRAGITMPDTLIALAALPPDRLPSGPQDH
jgi:hypothetical protein